MPKQAKGLTKAEIRRRQIEAGKARKGPRVEPRAGERISLAGYKVPEKYVGTRNAKRDRAIWEAVEAGKDKAKLAKKYGLSVRTVEYIARYYFEDEEGAA